ncbi:MAG: hypothetical protein ACKOYN_08685 [Planctomycetota bacterium]
MRPLTRALTCIAAPLALACVHSPLRADVLILDDGNRQVEGEVLEIRSDGVSFRAKIGGIWSTQFFPNDRIEKVRCKEGNQCDLELGDDSPGMRPDAAGNPRKPATKKPAAGGAGAAKGTGSGTGAATGAPAAGGARPSAKGAWKVGADPQPAVKAARIAEAKASVVAALEVAVAQRKAIDDALDLIAGEQQDLARAARDPDRDEAKDRARQVELFFEPDRLKKLIPSADEEVAALAAVAETAGIARQKILDAEQSHKARLLPAARLSLAEAWVAYQSLPERWTTERTAISAAWTDVDARVIADETTVAAQELSAIYAAIEKATAAKDCNRTVDALTGLGAAWTPRAVARAMHASSEQWSKLLPAARTVVDPTGAPLSAARHGELFEATQALAGLAARIHEVNKSWGKITGVDQVFDALETARVAYAENICTAAVDRLQSKIGDVEPFRSRGTTATKLQAERALIEDAVTAPLTALEWRFALKADRDRAERLLGNLLETLWDRTKDAAFDRIAFMRSAGEAEAGRTGGQFPKIGPLETVADGGTICAGLIADMEREVVAGQQSADAVARSNIKGWADAASPRVARFAAAREQARSLITTMNSLQREYDRHAPDIPAMVDFESEDNGRRAEGLAAFIRRHFAVTIDRVGFLQIAGVDMPAVQFRIKGVSYRCVLRSGNSVIWTEYMSPNGLWTTVVETFFDTKLDEVRTAVNGLLDRGKPFYDTDHLWRYCEAAHAVIFKTKSAR